MAESVRLLNSRLLKRNPDNPRLIFRTDELETLQQSIAEQGILVPLTVFQDGKTFRLLDGERRWRCAVKLGLEHVPVIIQPKPERLQNIMMMFAIHHARRDWDPLPTAIKLEELEAEFRARHGKRPTETELAGLASLTRGEVRRLKKLLQLPEVYRQELIEELEKPRAEQHLTVDHVLEASKAAAALRKREIVDARGEDRLRKAIIRKFKNKTIKNTVAPRKLAKLALAVERKEVTLNGAQRVVEKLIEESAYTIDDAFRESVERVDFERGLEQSANRLAKGIDEHIKRGYRPSERLRGALGHLAARIKGVLAR